MHYAPSSLIDTDVQPSGIATYVLPFQPPVEPACYIRFLAVNGHIVQFETLLGRCRGIINEDGWCE